MARRAPLKATGEPGAPTFFSYLRVSTDKQGASGLDPEAQREAFDRHIRAARRKVRAITGTARAGRHRPKASRLPPPPWVLLSPEAIRGHRARRLASRWPKFSLVVVHPPSVRTH